MALIFCDGFDHYQTITQKWDQESSFYPQGICSGQGRWNTNGWGMVDSWTRLWKAIPSGPQTKITMGAAINPSNGLGADCVLMSFDAGSYGLCSLCANGTHQLFITNGWHYNVMSGGLHDIQGWGTVPLRSGIYQYLEFQVDGFSSNGNVKVWLNGQLVIDLVGVVTTYGSYTAAQAFGFGSLQGTYIRATYGGAVYFDDVYVTDTSDDSGAGNTGNLGDVRIEELMPNADGYYKEWTPSSGSTHSDLVNDNPPDDDTTYVSTFGVGTRDTYTFPSVTPTFGNVKAVCVNFIARKVDAGTSELATIGRLGGVDGVGSSIYLGTEYGVYQSYMEKDPNSNIWTIPNVRNSEFGPKLVG